MFKWNTNKKLTKKSQVLTWHVLILLISVLIQFYTVSFAFYKMKNITKKTIKFYRNLISFLLQ